LLGLGLADYAIRAALRAKGGPVADDRVRRRRAKIEAELSTGIQISPVMGI
jgi:hypothetical protein